MKGLKNGQLNDTNPQPLHDRTSRAAILFTNCLFPSARSRENRHLPFPSPLCHNDLVPRRVELPA